MMRLLISSAKKITHKDNIIPAPAPAGVSVVSSNMLVVVKSQKQRQQQQQQRQRFNNSTTSAKVSLLTTLAAAAATTTSSYSRANAFSSIVIPTTTLNTKSSSRKVVVDSINPSSSSLSQFTLFTPTTSTIKNYRNDYGGNRYSTTTTRLYSNRGGSSSLQPNNNNDDNDNGNNIIQRGMTVAKNIAKSILPSSWFRTDEEKKQALARQQVKDDVTGSINELFKGAPLPIRMFSKSILSPLVGSVVSGLSETISQQQGTIDSVLQSATILLQNDRTVLTMFNGQIPSIGTPFSQSSSTISINGQMTSKINLAFPIQNGPIQGIVRLSSSNGIIDTLIVDIGGQRISIDTTIIPSSSYRSINSNFDKSTTTTSSSSRSRSSSTSYVNGDDNIIEAEIIEKKTNTR